MNLDEHRGWGAEKEKVIDEAILECTLVLLGHSGMHAELLGHSGMQADAPKPLWNAQ